MAFIKAERKKAKLRLGLVGPSGSGKSYTALSIASGLGKKIAAIDTERESLSLYAPTENDEGPCPQGYDTLCLNSFSPDSYVKAIKEAEQAGYDVLVIDSLSHAWNGKDGALEQVDKASVKAHGNKFAAWRDVTPMHNALVDAMLQAKLHIVATMRAKTEWVMETNERGKQVPRKIGLAPIQRDGMEYEFTLIADIDADHNMIVTKSRCSSLADSVISKPGPEIGTRLLAWLESGISVNQQPPSSNTQQKATPETQPTPPAKPNGTVENITHQLRDAIAGTSSQAKPAENVEYITANDFELIKNTARNNDCLVAKITAHYKVERAGHIKKTDLPTIIERIKARDSEFLDEPAQQAQRDLITSELERCGFSEDDLMGLLTRHYASLDRMTKSKAANIIAELANHPSINV